MKREPERVFPNDLLPRIIPADGWRKIEKGLTQRITALNMFLEDIYHSGRILSDGIVPRALVYSCRHYRREMRGLNVPRGVYVSVCGTDLVRLPDALRTRLTCAATTTVTPTTTPGITSA
jgi:uncharacterized circularly permuted ATP-grasp superfamily protein